MKVVFLDIDGVVNTLRWTKKDGDWQSGYNLPQDESVNDESALQWVSEFCEEYDYKIVVSSTWRKDGLGLVAKCLRNSGLRDSIEIYDATPVIEGVQRGQEIKAWLDAHPEVTGYVVFDDDSDMWLPEIEDRLVKCDTYAGFNAGSHNDAVRIHQAFNAA